jgi:hypothetical protein
VALLLLFDSAVIVFLNLRLLDKGKPPERVGRKATGLRHAQAGYGSGVAGQTQHLRKRAGRFPAKRFWEVR